MLHKGHNTLLQNPNRPLPPSKNEYWGYIVCLSLDNCSFKNFTFVLTKTEYSPYVTLK